MDASLIGPKYRLSKLRGLKDEATHTVPGRTSYRPNGQCGNGLAAESWDLGAVFGTETPLTYIPRLENSTIPPVRATMGFSRGTPPSGHPLGVLPRYSRSIDKAAKGPGGQNSTNSACGSEVIL